ncbi:Uncharacterised protein [Shewanella putrefaciens]|nr:hypothetical protein [Shewanella putrefaciens]SUI67209.1 Uncharacterised protein [Shewanella putrefaciens]
MKAIIGSLIVLLELSPRFKAQTFPPRWLPVGGTLSVFWEGYQAIKGHFF